MVLIETVNLSKKYAEREVLKNVNLKIERAEVFALIGPTGAGKTTLIRILDLLEAPSSGQFFFNGEDVSSHQVDRLALKRRMSYVHQRPLVFNMNVFDNVACGLRWRHLNSSIIKRKTEEALDLVGMASFRNGSAKTLSGGEMQRIAIARALVTEPEVLFLDEPTANMDPVSTAKVEEVLAHIINQRKTTIIMSTHNMSQGQRMANRLGTLIGGELLQTGTVSDIFNQPQNRAVAEFVGVENIIRGVVEGKDNELASIAVNGEKITAISNLPVGEKVDVLIRPEYIVFSSTPASGSARNVFKCQVNRINTIGSSVRIEATCGFPLLGVITVQSAQELGISIGKEIYASFKATAIHVIKRWN
ncbi:MAG TPA: ABC transporter ATP-binding protein [Dehalococcoidales bacterium]|nr:ABC transporter ATP-binding protein [Dehalococcoidales bacterium]